MSANFNAGNATASAGCQTPLIGLTFNILGRVVGAVNVGFERILGEVIVGRADVGIGQFVAYQPQRTIVVSRGVFGVHNDFYAVLFDEVEEVFFPVTDNDGDVCNSSFVELLDLAFDQNLSANTQGPLRSFVGDGGET